MTSLFADMLGDLSVICLRAMAEVQPVNVNAGTQQAPDHILALAGRADGSDDLGPPQ
jgi:hypothetical protein